MAINKKLIHFNTFENFNSKKLSANIKNTQYTLGVDGEIQSGSPDILYQSIVYIKNTKQQWTHGQLYEGEKFITHITYDELRGKAMRGLLEPGQLYAITDYNTLVNQPGIFSLYVIATDVSPFEIHNLLIVEAISETELSENAKLLRWFEPVDGAWTPEMMESFGHLQKMQEIDVKYDPYWYYDTETAFEKSKVNWVPKFAYDHITSKPHGVFYTHILENPPTSIGPIVFKQFLTYTGVNFVGQIGENGAPQIFWEFASGDSKYYLLSDRLRQPTSNDIGYIITKLSTEEGQNNILGPGNRFSDTIFTGYIYHAKDEWGNEAPYDFGCILKDASWINNVPRNISNFSPSETTTIITDYITNNIITPFMSTFTCGDLPAIITPYYYQAYWRNNVIKEVNAAPTGLKMEIDSNLIHIAPAPRFNCTDNYIGMNSYQVIMTSFSNIQNNIVGSGSNIFMLDPLYNKIGHYNRNIVTITNNNSIGNNNSFISLFGENNIVSDYCNSIVINQGHFNKVGSQCQAITFGSNCSENIIEDDCFKIAFGNNYSRNTIHMGSSRISFVDLSYETLNNVRFCNIGKNCKNIVLLFPFIMEDKNYVQNIEVEDGVNFYTSEQKFIEIPAINNDYKIRVGNDTRGVTKVWNSAETLSGESNIYVENGHAYVDLGLPSGLLWATCNVGTNKPKEYGDYFAWGETNTKTTYTENNYSVNVDVDISGDPQYDVARANWGGNWRMPTKDEMRELVNNCTWTWIDKNNIIGYKIVSNINNKNIFLPAGGYYDAKFLFANDGNYWTSTPDKNNAYRLLIDFDTCDISSRVSYCGRSIRPVFGGNFEIPQTHHIHFTSNDIINITDTSIVCSSNIKLYNDFPILEKGFCWSTSSNPTINDNKVISTSDSLTLEISNLTPTTTYYIKPYAINEYGISYGEERVIGTATGEINGHYYVDLGLPSGIKWSIDNVNISGSKPYGDYFAWGETSPKEEYTKENSLTQGLNVSELQSQGYVDENGNLTPEHDAATANWGSTWRMPTAEEMAELFNNFTDFYIHDNSIITLIGPSGGSICYYARGNSEGDNSIAWYYASTANETNTYSGQIVPGFNVKQQGYYITRYKGYYIKPVSI